MKKLFFLLCFSLALSGFAVARAASDPACSGFEAQFKFLSNGSNIDIDPTSGLPKVCTAGSAISWITNMALGFAGVVAVGFVIVGGYMYLTSAGNEEAAEKGKKVLINAIIGLIIIILSATIIRVVVNTLDTGGGGGAPAAGTPSGGTPAGGTPAGGAPPAGAPAAGGASEEDKNTLKNGFSIAYGQVNFSLSKAKENSIKKACSVASVGDNVSISAMVGTEVLGSSTLSVQGENFVGQFSLNREIDVTTEALFSYVCGTIVDCSGKCQ